MYGVVSVWGPPCTHPGVKRTPTQVLCLPIPAEHDFRTWWTKALLFTPSASAAMAAALGDAPATGRRIVFMDLDTVITGALDALCAYAGPFALLSVEGELRTIISTLGQCLVTRCERDVTA